MTRPFLDQPIQFGPSEKLSARFNILTTLACSSALCDLATLKTRRSPLRVCVASMSDLDFVDEACQARVTIGDGGLDVVTLYRIWK